MNLGLQRGTVALEAHNPAWAQLAAETITMLKQILGSAALDVQHVGSTAIQGIAAKPIIDIAVGVRDFDAILPLNRELEAKGVLYRGADVDGQLLYVMGDLQKDCRTHHIHVVIYGSEAWNHYINFRDYLNFDSAMATEYSALKQSLGKAYQNDRARYTQGKQALIAQILAMASAWRAHN